MNLILNTDSYKSSHYLQYPPNTSKVFSYIEAREGGRWNRTIFFGLQAFLMEYMSKPITQENIDEAGELFKLHGEPFNREGWISILKDYGGYLPIEIKAIPEGSNVPTGNVLVTVVNTDPKYYWLTNYIETALLRAVWYPTTVCTLSWHIRQTILKYLKETSDNPSDSIQFMLNDFGSRGVSSYESSGIGGASHLVNFSGTDNVLGLVFARKYYSCNMGGYSIPAAEHSTITTWGKQNEVLAYTNMLDKFTKYKTIAVVSDSYDLVNAVENLWGKDLKERLINSKSRIVIRPDSGDPVRTPIYTVQALMEKFGATVNTRGYRILPPYLRVIQGDGIKEETIKEICELFKHNGLSVDNICFGMGGGLLQELNRDTLKFAMKCSAIEIDGFWKDVYKESPGKQSKKGQLGLFKTSTNKFVTDRLENNYRHKYGNQLQTVYINGPIEYLDTLENIRKRANG